MFYKTKITKQFLYYTMFVEHLFYENTIKYVH